jgi:hypothetical protein
MNSPVESLSLGTSDIPELHTFLRDGFGEADDYIGVRPEVLSWKYWEPCGWCSSLPRSLGIREEGGLIAHLGLVPRSFLVRGPNPMAVTTSHHIDWLSQAAQRRKGSGLTLLMHYMKMINTQYSLGGTPISVKTMEAAGFERRAEFPCMWRVLRPGYRLRNRQSANMVQSAAQAAKDLGRYLTRPVWRPQRALEMERVARFGAEVDAIVDSWPDPLILTTRSGELLNYYLQFPGGSMSGWLFRAAGRPVGFAVLNVLSTGAGHLGNIVECFLESPDVDLWHAAIVSLTRQLGVLGADLAQCMASTAWAEKACYRTAYRPMRQPVVLLLRDRDRTLPRDLPFHLTKLEGDHAYLFKARAPGAATPERGDVAGPGMAQPEARAARVRLPPHRIVSRPPVR